MIPKVKETLRRWCGIFARSGLLFAVLIGSACYDVREHRIPNWWILAGFFCGLALVALEAEEGRINLDAGGYLLRIFLSSAVLFPLFVLRMIGAGDIKLMAVMVGYLGIRDGARAVLYGCLVGAFLALVKLLVRKNLWWRLNYLLVYFRRLFQTKKIVPYYQPERDGYGVVIPFAFCLLIGYAGYLLLGQ